MPPRNFLYFLYQQYPPGTHGNYGIFSSIIPITQNGKTLEVPKGGRGPKGEPGVPPILYARFGRPAAESSSMLILNRSIGMSVVKDYTFYNLDRIEDDATCQTQRTQQNTRFSSHLLSNNFSDGAQVQFATAQPAIFSYGANGGSAVGGARIDDESILYLKTEEERALGRLQLLQRPFLTVPYLGKGSCDPDLESQLLQGEIVADKKSVSTIMAQSFMGYTLYPTSDKMEERVNDARFTVQEAALDGWVRGGAATRDMAEDPMLKGSHKPNNRTF